MTDDVLDPASQHLLPRHRRRGALVRYGEDVQVTRRSLWLATGIGFFALGWSLRSLGQTPAPVIPGLISVTVDGLPVTPNVLVRDTRPLDSSTPVQLCLQWEGADPTVLTITGVTLEANGTETISGRPFRCFKLGADAWTADGSECLFHYHFVPPSKRGDTNHDGSLNLIDIAKTKANLGAPLVSQAAIDCDVDRDGDVDMDDIAAIRMEIDR